MNEAVTTNSDEWRRVLGGRFIVFDGPDGCGKTTQFRRFGAFAEEQGVEVCTVREPGGTSIGEQIREVLLDVKNEEMEVRCELLLYMASRAQLVAEVLGPARERGELILADRFVSSTLAYQGTAGGVSAEDIRAIARIALRDVQPDLYVIFDVDSETAAGRLDAEKDRMERKGNAFHERVREGYRAQVEAEPERYVLINAWKSVEEVWREVVAEIGARLG